MQAQESEEQADAARDGELDVFGDRPDNRLAQAEQRDGDEQQALTVEPLEEVIDELNKNIKKRHVKRLRKGKCTIDLGLILSDIATNYERVADHCSNIALYLIQGQDTELEAHSYVTHLREKDDTSFELQVESFTEKYGLGKNK